MLLSNEDWISFYLLINLRIEQKILIFRINNYTQSVQSTDNQSDIKDLSFFSTSISPLYTFSLAGTTIVYTPSQCKK